MDARFDSALWPEDIAPAEAGSYRQCEVCTQSSRVIWGEGNPKAPVVAILDNPGAREDRKGNPYLCPTRQTLQALMHTAHLSAEDVYLTYLLKCRPLRRYRKEEARAFSKPYLLRQIERMRPRLLVCLGDVVARTVFGDAGVSVKTLRGSWHDVLGYPCMVSYHPLAVRRRPNLLRHAVKNWSMLAARL